MTLEDCYFSIILQSRVLVSSKPHKSDRTSALQIGQDACQKGIFSVFHDARTLSHILVEIHDTL